MHATSLRLGAHVVTQLSATVPASSILLLLKANTTILPIPINWNRSTTLLKLQYQLAETPVSLGWYWEGYYTPANMELYIYICSWRNIHLRTLVYANRHRLVMRVNILTKQQAHEKKFQDRALCAAMSHMLLLPFVFTLCLTGWTPLVTISTLKGSHFRLMENKSSLFSIIIYLFRTILQSRHTSRTYDASMCRQWVLSPWSNL